MFFISAPQCLRVPNSHIHHTVICHANSHASNRKTNPADPDPRKHPRSPRRSELFHNHVTPHHSSSSSSHPSSTTESFDIRNTPIDDQTTPETLIYQSSRKSPIDPIKVESKARMAARSSSHPKPKQNPSAETNNTKKKKRGRPKGSKSVNQSSMPQPQISPFMLAVREDIRRRSIAANRDIVSGLFDVQSDDPVKWDDVQLSAPNGLPDSDAPDFLQELLPIIAQRENEQRRVVDEEEQRIKELVSTSYTQFSSVHRFSDRLDNLKPYKTEEKSEEECQTCSGAGMTVCEYCKGEGFVDLGKDGEKFNPKFGNNVFTMPKRVTGNIYHCPLCGGMQKERCVSCFGTGTITNGSNIFEAPSKRKKEERAWKVFDMNELIEQERDRIEIGIDGTIIMRAKRRGRRKKGTEKVERPKRRTGSSRSTKSVAQNDIPLSGWDGDGAEPATVTNYDADLVSDLQGFTGDTSRPLQIDGTQSVIPSAPQVVIPPGRPIRRTTDFVNTTDYQVGRRLQRQPPPNIGQEFQATSNDFNDISLSQDDDLDGTTGRDQ